VPGRAGGYPTGPPTVPDVSHSLIRFLSIRAAVAGRIPRRLTKPAGAELGCPSPGAGNLLRRVGGSMSFPSVLPVPHSTRPRLPSGGSLGPAFPTFVGTMLRTLGQNLGVIFPSIYYFKTFFYFSSSCKGFVPKSLVPIRIIHLWYGPAYDTDKSKETATAPGGGESSYSQLPDCG